MFAATAGGAIEDENPQIVGHAARKSAKKPKMYSNSPVDGHLSEACPRRTRLSNLECPRDDSLSVSGKLSARAAVTEQRWID